MTTSSCPFSEVSIVLADDHDLVRSGIKSLLSQIPGVSVDGEARDGHELIAAVRKAQPDIVMADITMPGMDGLNALAQLHVEYPELRLVVISTHDTADVIRQAVANGACGYLTKDASPAELKEAVHRVMGSGSFFSSEIARRLLEPAEPAVDEELTARQVEILTLLAKGMASKQIAFELGLSSKTVDVHRSRIMERLDLHDVPSLTRYAVRKKLVEA